MSLNFKHWIIEENTISQALRNSGPREDQIVARAALAEIKAGATSFQEEWHQNKQFSEQFIKWLTFNWMKEIYNQNPIIMEMAREIARLSPEKLNRYLAGSREWSATSYSNSPSHHFHGVASEQSPNSEKPRDQKYLKGNHLTGTQRPRFFASSLMPRYRHFLAANYQDAKLKSKLNDPAFDKAKLNQEIEEWHELLKQAKRVPASEVYRIILPLDNLGAKWKGWKWVALDRPSCDEEGEAMGHCGNNGDPRDDDNIFSLRDPRNYAHVTFIENNKIIGEMKGYGNNKPTKKYHPAIKALITSEFVEVLKGGGYLPEENFDFEDLPKKDQEEILKLKPHIGDYFGYIMQESDPNKKLKELGNMVNYTLEEIITFDGEEHVVIDRINGFQELYDLTKYGTEKVEDFSWMEDDYHDFDWPDKHWWKDIEKNLKAEQQDMLNTILNCNFKNGDYDDIEKEEWDDMSLFEKLEVDENNYNPMERESLKQYINYAYESAIRDGAHNEAWRDIKYSFSKTNNGFLVDLENHPWKLMISMNDLKSIYNDLIADETDENGHFDGEFVELFDFSYQAPYYGYSDWSDNSFDEVLKDNIQQLAIDCLQQDSKNRRSNKLKP